MSKKPKANPSLRSLADESTSPRTSAAAGGAAGTAAGAVAGSAAGRGYTVLARRYRSREFDELVGQEAITQTLRNAMAQDRVAHAYLFTGTRGVGKTSMARLLAKALNATDDLSERDAIAAAILRGDDMDVIEIDGASNRGIDNARDLIAGAGIAPARCRHKIYIIDEVHMLTTPAFNALLKTMEEPPSHVKFILCTTEAHKVPATIQSRCQRFDFRSIPAARIAAHLRSVLESESVAFDDQAVMQVARLADGSMRDGLSLLDRLIAGVDAGGALDAALLERMLGLPDQTLVLALLAAIADGDAGAALTQADALLQRGHSVEQAIETLVEHLRTLMIVVACGGDSDLVERSGDAREAAIAQAARFDAAGLVHMIALCEATARSVRVSSAARALFDALVVRLSLAAHVASIPALLEGRFASGTATATEKKKPVTPPLAMVAAEAASAPAAPAAPMTGIAPAAPVVTPPRIDHTPQAKAAGPAPARSSAVAPSPAVAESPSSDDIAELWTAVLRLAEQHPRDHALVAELEPIALDGKQLRVRAGADEPAMRKALLVAGPKVTDLVRRATGRTVSVTIEAAAEPARSAPPAGALLEELMRHPLVREAADLFDARVVGMRRVALASADDATEDATVPGPDGQGNTAPER